MVDLSIEDDYLALAFFDNHAFDQLEMWVRFIIEFGFDDQGKSIKYWVVMESHIMGICTLLVVMQQSYVLLCKLEAMEWQVDILTHFGKDYYQVVLKA